MKVSKQAFLTLNLFFLFISAKSQEISIANISDKRGFFDTNIEISGSGFSATLSNLEVWFGAAQGTIESSRENLIIARIPAGATTSTITVLNKVTGLSASSSMIFHEAFRGAPNPVLSTPDVYTFPNTQELFDLIIVDLDKDGKNDIVATKIDNSATNVVVYRNITNGANIDFAEQNISIGSPTSKIATGDIDGDGKQDIVISREATNRFQIFVLRNTSTPGSISFAAPKNFFIRSSQFAKKIVIKDLNLDGKPEVVVANTSDDEISIFENISTVGNVNLSSSPVRFNTGGTTSNDLIIEDFNEDGKQDIAVTQFAGADVLILPNTSSSGSLQFGTPITVKINGNLNNLVAGDLNEDGKIDIAVTDPFSNKLSVVLNESTDAINFSIAQVFDAGIGGASLALTDFLGNGRLDILVTSSSGGEFSVFGNTSSGGTLSLTRSVVPQTNYSVSIVAGDLSDDSKPDIAFTARDPGGINFFLVAVRNQICIDPSIVNDNSPAICTGQTYRFKTPPSLGTTFIWKKDGIDVKNSVEPFFDATAGGSYSVTAVSEGGLCTFVSPAVILTLNTGTIPANPVASDNGPTCIGGSVTLSASTITGATYSWFGPNGYTSIVQNPVLTDITSDMAGQYTVIAQLSPCESMPASTFVEVINPPDATLSINGSSRICEGETVTLSVGLATGYTYQWFKDNVAVPVATTNQFSVSASGAYSVNLKGISNNCDLTSLPVTVETFPPPAPIFTSSGSLCVGSVISFSETSVKEADQIATLSWDFGDLSTPDTSPNPTHSYAAAGNYTVTLTMGYQNHACTDFSTSAITIGQPTAFSIQVTGNISFCLGDSVLLEVPSTGFTGAVWSTGAQGLSMYAKSAGTISVDATNSSGCVSTDQIDVSTLPPPNVVASADQDIITIGQSVQLTASGAETYTWSPVEGLDDPLIANPVANPQITTLYEVVGTDLIGCIGKAEITISVEDTGGKLPIDAPILFSPNGDGIDDFWVVGNIQNFPDCELVIFSRNGKTIFEVRGYNNTWDGRDLSGNDVPEGAYFFTLSCPDGKSASGSISIVR